MDAEDRIGRVGQVCLGLVGRLLDDLLGIMAGFVARKLKREAAAAARVGRHVYRIVSQLAGRQLACDRGRLTRRIGRAKARACA